MAKLLLLSTVLMTVAMPIMAARRQSARQGLKVLVYGMLAFNLFWVFAALEIYPRLPH
jgi:hypothetical protein